MFLLTGNTFNGDISNDIDKQIEYVKLFAKQCLRKQQEFKNIEEICDARVPIVKFFHVATKLNCDVSFKSGLSLYNSKLIAYVVQYDFMYFLLNIDHLDPSPQSPIYPLFVLRCHFSNVYS